MRPTWESEEGVRLGSHADAEQGRFGLFVDLGFPVVDVVLFRYGQVAHDGAFGIVKLDFGAAFDEAVGDFEFRLKFPSRDALFLDGEIL